LEQKPEAATLADAATPAPLGDDPVAMPGTETPAANEAEVIATATAPVVPDAIDTSGAQTSAADPSVAGGASDVVAVATGPVTPEAAASATSPDNPGGPA
jgi:hypothetical protein